VLATVLDAGPFGAPTACQFEPGGELTDAATRYDTASPVLVALTSWDCPVWPFCAPVWTVNDSEAGRFSSATLLTRKVTGIVSCVVPSVEVS
jgi:hypothetical protein